MRGPAGGRGAAEGMQESQAAFQQVAGKAIFVNLETQGPLRIRLGLNGSFYSGRRPRQPKKGALIIRIGFWWLPY